jgi:hypothetical protein
MPKTPFDLDHGLVLWQDNIGLSGKFAHMKAESETEPVERFSDQHLRLGVL